MSRIVPYNGPPDKGSKSENYKSKSNYNNFTIPKYMSNLKNLPDDIENKLSDIAENITENIHINEFINNRRGELIKVKKKCGLCFNTLSLLYDHSIDNLPGASIVGCLMTAIAFSYIIVGMNGVNTIIYNYLGESISDEFFNNCITVIFLACVLHLCILLHGFSIFILETSREVCLVKRVGCYCCKNKNLRKCCICFQTCAQYTTQIVWGIVGTISCLGMYAFSIALFSVSIASSSTSYFLKHNCDHFSQLASTLRDKSVHYLQIAKHGINTADKTMFRILSQYNAWVNMKDQFLENSMQTLTTGKETGQRRVQSIKLWKPQHPHRNHNHVDYHMRLLSNSNHSDTQTFNILDELSKGQKVINILNRTIFETEKQITYYDNIFNHSLVVCNDYGNMYGYFNDITVGLSILLVSHLVMSAVHYKYFSVWMYEAKLIKLN